MVFKLIIIFIAVLFLDLLVLPAFFGFRNSFLSLLILIIPVLYRGPTRQFIAYGLIFTFISESLRGSNFGDLAVPFLFTVTVIYLTQRFLDIKYTFDTRFGLGKSVLIALMSVAFIYALNIGYFGFMMILTVTLEALALVFAFNIVFNKKSDYV